MMAEAIGLASGLLTLAAFALKSTVALYETVKGFRSHQQRVRDLVDELSALAEVLGTLTETLNSTSDLDLSALKIPLLRCGNACNEFQEELLKCVARSGASHTSFRDWAKLRFMGENIDDFKRVLASYKLTVNIALTDATLRKSSATAERIEACFDLVNTARAGLEDHLESIAENLERVLAQNTAEAEVDDSEIRKIREERLSTEKSLQICAQLSEHINQLQLLARESMSRADSTESDSVCGAITDEGLEECKSSIARTVSKLEEHEKQLFARLKEKLRTASASDEDQKDLTRLRDEWESARQSIDICSQARDALKNSVSTVDNYATGDAIQFMVSTNNKTIHGRNRGVGWKTRQAGGHMNDTSLQKIAQTFSNVNISLSDRAGPAPSDEDPQGSVVEDPQDPKFKGKGFKLS